MSTQFIGQKLREARLKSGIGVTEVSYKTGCAVPSIYAYERGAMVPSLSVLQSICKIIGADVGELARCEIPSMDLRRAMNKKKKTEDTKKGKTKAV